MKMCRCMGRSSLPDKVVFESIFSTRGATFFALGFLFDAGVTSTFFIFSVSSLVWAPSDYFAMATFVVESASSVAASRGKFSCCAN